MNDLKTLEFERQPLVAATLFDLIADHINADVVDTRIFTSIDKEEIPDKESEDEGQAQHLFACELAPRDGGPHLWYQFIDLENKWDNMMGGEMFLKRATLRTNPPSVWFVKPELFEENKWKDVLWNGMWTTQFLQGEVVDVTNNSNICLYGRECSADYKALHRVMIGGQTYYINYSHRYSCGDDLEVKEFGGDKYGTPKTLCEFLDTIRRVTLIYNEKEYKAEMASSKRSHHLEALREMMDDYGLETTEELLNLVRNLHENGMPS